jgi:hypothetical protein
MRQIRHIEMTEKGNFPKSLTINDLARPGFRKSLSVRALRHWGA